MENFYLQKTLADIRQEIDREREEREKEIDRERKEREKEIDRERKERENEKRQMREQLERERKENAELRDKLSRATLAPQVNIFFSGKIKPKKNVKPI